MELDSNFTHLLELLHSDEAESYGKLKKSLEEMMIKKYGNASEKPLENMSTKFDIPKRPVSMTESIKGNVQDSGGHSSDNELVFTLLKDDLTCVVCHGMDVSAGNQLIECHLCHALYHQDCHNPYITDLELNDPRANWVCSSCKYRMKKSKYSSSTGNSRSGSNHSSSYHLSSKSSISKSLMGSSTPMKASSSGGSSSSTLKVGVGSSYSSQQPSHSSKQQNSSSNSLSPKSLATSGQGSGSLTLGNNNTQSHRPNINIISADKRLQIMKRKAAAKFQDKRKSKNYSSN